jgi:hypothetical protein
MSGRIRIADDPGSWIVPDDLKEAKKAPLPADPMAMAKCTKCGVMWMYHDTSKCQTTSYALPECWEDVEDAFYKAAVSCDRQPSIDKFATAGKTLYSTNLILRAGTRCLPAFPFYNRCAIRLNTIEYVLTLIRWEDMHHWWQPISGMPVYLGVSQDAKLLFPWPIPTRDYLIVPA